MIRHHPERLYVPGPEIRPLLLRPQRWAGGMTPIAVAALAALAGPAVLGVCTLVWELDPLLRQ